MLVCHRDLFLAICSAKALNLALGEALPWVFHDDGSLKKADGFLLRGQFPGCRLIERAEADASFASLPEVAVMRRKHFMLLKLADLSRFAERERILYVDSDILFFRRPDYLLSVLEGDNNRNYFNRDINSCYVAEPEVLRERTGIVPPDRVNGGLSALNRNDISTDKIADLLPRLEIKSGNDVYFSHLIEQTAVSLLAASSPGGWAHLPPEYDVMLEKPVVGAVCKHYVGVIREQYEMEGLMYLLRDMNFLSRWKAFSADTGHRAAGADREVRGAA